MTRALFVLGMHRSGTSAITRVVNLLGVPLAPEDELRPGDVENPRGFWEVPALTRINERVLNLFGGSWIAPPSLEPGWDEDGRLYDLGSEARATLARVHGTQDWIWKDPRNCLTMPFWLRVAEMQPAVVLVHRHPLEVAGSLAKRDELPAAVSVALWERYNRAALASATGMPAFVTSYDRLLSEPATVAAELLDFLQPLGFRVDSRSREAVVSFLDPSLRRSNRVELADAIDSSQLTLLKALADLEGPHDALTPPSLPPEPGWVETLLDARRRVLELERLRRAASRTEAMTVWKRGLGLELGVDRAGLAWRLLAPVVRLRAQLVTPADGR